MKLLKCTYVNVASSVKPYRAHSPLISATQRGERAIRAKFD